MATVALAPPCTVAVDVLVDLFAGDLETPGHPTVELGCRIAERLNPPTVTDFARMVLGDLPDGLHDPHLAAVLRLAFDCWHHAGRPTAQP